MINKLKMFIRILCYLFIACIIIMMFYVTMQEILFTILIVVILAIIQWAFDK